MEEKQSAEGKTQGTENHIQKGTVTTTLTPDTVGIEVGVRKKRKTEKKRIEKNTKEGRRRKKKTYCMFMICTKHC